MTSVFDAGSALCAPFLGRLPVAGLSISVVSDGGAQSTVGTSDRIAERLEELQFRLGEGPTPDVLRSARPVLVVDLDDGAAQASWPLFGIGAIDAGARGVFAFPLLAGHVTVGVVSMYAVVLLPPWSASQLSTAVGLAEATARPAMELAARSAAVETPPVGRRQTEMRREVHQASGMLTVQLHCDIDEALARLRAHAFARELPIDAVAREVVAGTLDLGAHGD